MSGFATCRWCEQRHEPRYLCDPAARILAELRRRGMEGTMPTLEFPKPIPAEQFGLGPDSRIVHQIVVQAATIPVGDVPRPAILLTGRDAHGPLLHWLYAAGDDEMARLAQLVADMTALAVRTARSQRGIHVRPGDG